MITECWSEIPEVRWDVHTVHQHLSAEGIEETAEGEEYQLVFQTATHVKDSIPFPGTQVVAPNPTSWRIHMFQLFLRIFILLTVVGVILYFSYRILPLFIALLILIPMVTLFLISRILRWEGVHRIFVGFINN